MMTQAILIPVFVLVLLAFVHLYRARGGAVEIRSFDQFDLLFCVLVALLIPTRHADLVFVVLACVFVFLRIVGGGLVLTGNSASLNRQASVGACIVLFVMWALYAFEILIGT